MQLVFPLNLMEYFKKLAFLMKTTPKQMNVNEDASAVTVEWRDVELRKQKELGRFTFQVGRKQ